MFIDEAKIRVKAGQIGLPDYSCSRSFDEDAAAQTSGRGCRGVAHQRRR